MTYQRWVKPVLFGILASWILAACLGEPQLPPLESKPVATLAGPQTDPTAAAAPRLSLQLERPSSSLAHSIPQVPHDLIGRNDCQMCHKQGVSGAPRIPDAHRGLESESCLTCHTAPVSAELSAEELYSRVCSRCHGEDGMGGVGPALNHKPYLEGVSDDELREAIIRGRGAAEMLAWGDLGLLTVNQVDALVALIRSWEPNAPETVAATGSDTPSAKRGDSERGQTTYSQFCSGCHGLDGETEVVPGLTLRQVAGSAGDGAIARIIRDGEEGMPSFHALLTTDDVSNLLALFRTWHAGPDPTPTPIQLSGEEIFARVCARCHGPNGEGGIGAPLNSKEFLAANDDESLRQWIERGTLGTSMLSWGDLGLLQASQIDQLVSFIRAWEPTAPSTTGGDQEFETPSAASGDPAHGEQLFAQFCSGCHGLDGKRQTGPIVLNSAEFLSGVNDGILAFQIQNGGREMPSFHSIITSQDLNDLLAYIRAGFNPSGSSTMPSFSAEVMPVFEASCLACHGAAGGWSAATYDEVVNSGNNAPVLIPGDPDNSLLMQKLRGNQTSGGPMPPGALLTEAEIALIASWIAQGAPNN